MASQGKTLDLLILFLPSYIHSSFYTWIINGVSIFLWIFIFMDKFTCQNENFPFFLILDPWIFFLYVDSMLEYSKIYEKSNVMKIQICWGFLSDITNFYLTQYNLDYLSSQYKYLCKSLKSKWNNQLLTLPQSLFQFNQKQLD